MPQMMPFSWFNLTLYFMFLFILTMIIMSYMDFLTVKSSKSMLKKNMFKMKW